MECNASYNRADGIEHSARHRGLISTLRVAGLKGLMKERGPIFYDAERVRWRRTRRVMEVIAVLLTVSLAYFLYRRGHQCRSARRFASRYQISLSCAENQTHRQTFARPRRPPPPRRQPRHSSRQLRSIARRFFVSWDPNSMASLKAHYKDIDLLIPEQLHSVSQRRSHRHRLRKRPENWRGHRRPGSRDR